MGVSTDGQICYGWIFEEDYKFPWKNYEEEEWWAHQHGFKKIGDYIKLQKWLKENPLPFDVINYCSNEAPMFILAVPGTVLIARRGFPEQIHDLLFEISKKTHLQNFIKQYNLEPEEGPAWYLSSFWS